MSIGCYDLLLEEVSQRIKETPPDSTFLVADVVAAVGSITIKTQHDIEIASTTTVISCKECAPWIFAVLSFGCGWRVAFGGVCCFREESYNIKYARLCSPAIVVLSTIHHPYHALHKYPIDLRSRHHERIEVGIKKINYFTGAALLYVSP
eukprot:scaffold13732_cov73-Skeletonema_dohrnii-CCMP3373.AAC.1